MRPDCEQIARALTSRGIITCIITNGFRLTPEMIDALKNLNIESVAVSLDGVEEVHDPFRQKGSYRRALEAIDTLTAAGILPRDAFLSCFLAVLMQKSSGRSGGIWFGIQACGSWSTDAGSISIWGLPALLF